MTDRPLPVSCEIQHTVEQFLYYEASLLDDGQFDEWLQLFTEDAEYYAPVRETLDERTEAARDSGAMALFIDNKSHLEVRVARLKTGMAHAEMPRSRTRRSISNIITQSVNSEYSVRCNFTVFVSRLEKTEFSLHGSRIDVLQINEGDLKIRKRSILLDQTLLPRAISIFL